jgi:hypothetical protein
MIRIERGHFVLCEQYCFWDHPGVGTRCYLEHDELAAAGRVQAIMAEPMKADHVT